MIKNVLIPESYNGYYLFSKRIIGFYIDDMHISATQVYLKGNKTVVEQVVHEVVEQAEGVGYEEAVGRTVTDILKRIGQYDAVHTVLPSSQVIFKTLKLPFLDYEQIKMVVHFEVEPLLPFSLDQAVIDFIITKQFPEENSSEIIVAAVQKTVVAEHFSFFEHVQGGPENIGIDLFGLYGVYQKIPSYMSIDGGVALIDTGERSTRVAFIYNGQLKAVRVLSKGSDDFITQVSTITGRSYGEVKELIFTRGLHHQEDHAFHGALVQELKSFLSHIQFTLGSFASRENQLSISRFILSGLGTHIPGVNEFITEHTGVVSEHFQVAQLFVDKKIEIKKMRALDVTDLVSLGSALPSLITQDFNLLPVDICAERGTSLLGKQLIMALVFVCLMFGSLFIFSYLQVSMMRQELMASEEEVVEVLKKAVVIPGEDVAFDEIIKKATDAVKKEENTWFPFSAQSQFLRYLLELHTLDQEGLGLDVERVTITKDAMTLKAKVKDFNAVKALEQELGKSKLFRYEDSIQKTDFIIKIGLNRG